MDKKVNVYWNIEEGKYIFNEKDIHDNIIQYKIGELLGKYVLTENVGKMFNSVKKVPKKGSIISKEMIEESSTDGVNTNFDVSKTNWL